MTPVNWCAKCASRKACLLECIGKRSLCEWCSKDCTPPSMWKGIKKLQQATTGTISSDGIKHKQPLLVSIKCFDCGYLELIPFDEFPTFGNGYFVDTSILNNLMCRQCFGLPSITMIPMPKKSGGTYG